MEKEINWGSLIFSGIVFLLVFVALNFDKLSELKDMILPTKESPISVPLCKDKNADSEYNDDQDISLAKQFAKRRVYVPDYYADIVIEAKDVRVSENINIFVSVKDKGRIEDKGKGVYNLSRPYFYILLFNPDNKLEAVFPCSCFDKGETILSLGTSRYAGNGRVWDLANKIDFNPWQYRACLINGISTSWDDKNCSNDYFQVLNECKSRNLYINGKNELGKVVYQYKAEKQGLWKVYVFLFDDGYVNRETGTLRGSANTEDEYSRNAIQSVYAEFMVDNRPITEPVKYSNIDMVWLLISIIISGVFAFASFKRDFYSKVKVFYENVINWCNRNRDILLFNIIFLILTLVLVLVFIISYCRISI